jgi:DNA replication protein DnaC
MKKGTLYHGAVGVGKTTRLRAEYEAVESKGKRWITARDVTRTAIGQGLAGVENLGRNYLDLFIDDIGHEPLTAGHFGTVFSPLAELIQARYDSYMEWPAWEQTLHITTNLSPEELRVRYGDYILDRLVEMCDWVHIEGQSFRK